MIRMFFYCMAEVRDGSEKTGDVLDVSLTPSTLSVEVGGCRRARG